MTFLKNKFELYLYFCVAMFFFLLSIVLFYSFGYKYNINENKTIQTGAIVIKSTPKNVNIFRNDKLFTTSLSLTNFFSDFIKIEELEDNIYNIKISKDEYFQWEKNVEVRSGFVTELKNIVLLKNNYTKKILLKNILNDSKNNIFFVSNKKNKILYIKDTAGSTNLFIYDLNNNIETNIAPYNKMIHSQSLNNYIIEDVLWSKYDSRIIIKTKSTKQSYKSFLVDLADEFKIYDVSFIFQESDSIKNNWNFDFNNKLFFIKENDLLVYDPIKKTSNKIIKNVSSFMIDNGYLYYINQNDNILYYKYLPNQSIEKKIVILPEKDTKKIIYKITKSNDNTFLILSSEGILYFVDEKNNLHTINNSVTSAIFANNQKRILYNNNHELWIYYIEEKISQPTKEKATNELLTRFSGQISNVSLYKDEEHIFYKEGAVYKFLEIDNRDKKNIFELFNLSDNNILYLPNQNSIYYLENDKFMQIDLNEE